MHGSTESIVPAYSVNVTTFSANLYYCSACWRKMLAALRKKRQPRTERATNDSDDHAPTAAAPVLWRLYGYRRTAR
jgi:hypothetical protein